MKHEKPLICPACGSQEVSPEKDYGIGKVIGMLLMLIPLPIYVKKFHCIDCGNIFRKKDNPQTTHK
ncbi:MAG: hypothetical protein ACKOXF_05700 [Chitinophagaceae bacterium]